METNSSLYYNTVTSSLLNVLRMLMAASEFDSFRLVGGTALSLQRGHRQSADIDLFTDAEYRSINFETIDKFLVSQYSYCDSNSIKVVGVGKSYYVGEDKNNCIKLDLYYTDKFIDDPLIIDGIRLASVEEILAMKVDVISRIGRKKDFWDIHELLEDFNLDQMLALHEKRHPYTHERALIIENFTDFSGADGDFDPVCLRSKHWEIIKLDIIDFVSRSS
jgi:hypothetical protein